MKKPVAKLVILLACALGLTGCAARYYQRIAGVNEWTVPQVLHRALDRWVGWRSLATQFKLTVRVGDEQVAARGHLIYLLGERIEFGFRKPWDRFIGTFYVIPTQTVYWGKGPISQVYGLSDRVDVAEILAFPFPNWDPRDFLPLPVSGRTSGLQPDSVWSVGPRQYVRARADSVTHELSLSLSRGVVTSEVVRRAGRTTLFKRYEQFKTVKGWPLPVKTVCSDSLGTFSLTWVLGGVELDAQDFELEDTIQTFGTPTGGGHE